MYLVLCRLYITPVFIKESAVIIVDDLYEMTFEIVNLRHDLDPITFAELNGLSVFTFAFVH